MKEQYWVNIEFRYTDLEDIKYRHSLGDTKCVSKTITIGVFDTIEEAYEKGNAALEKFEKRFKFNPHYNRKERFSKNGGPFGTPEHLITNTTWIQTPFQLFAKIEKLKYEPVEDAIDEALAGIARYKDWKIRNEDE
jgi:hypothetical protein